MYRECSRSGRRYIATGLDARRTSRCTRDRSAMPLGVSQAPARRGAGRGRRLVPLPVPRPLRHRRARHRLAAPRKRGRAVEIAGRQGPGRRGGHHRLVRRDRHGRARPRHGDPGGPARQAAHLPARPGLPARGHAGDPGRRRPARARGADPHRVRARSPCPAPRPGSPGPAGSSSRAATTPSWSRRSGATTCGSRAWSWSTSTASTTSPSTCATSGPAPSAGSACSSTTWCPAPRRAGSPHAVARSPRRQARAGRRAPVRRRLGRR